MATSRKKSQPGARFKSALILVDTNILLDFYRMHGSIGGLKLLNSIEKNAQRIITGIQIEMEFKKNRQRVLLESLNRKRIDWSSLQMPAFLETAKPARAIDSFRAEIEKRQEKVRARIEGALRDPVRKDPIYQCLQRLFRAKSKWNLDRAKKVRRHIRELALRRFILGYPPRKANDNSIGDAVNWEWTIHCAKSSGKPVIIASRDSDFGCAHAGQLHLNDALRQEFHERVSQTRGVILVDRLSKAFELAGIGVDPAEAKEEAELIQERETNVRIHSRDGTHTIATPYIDPETAWGIVRALFGPEATMVSSGTAPTSHFAGVGSVTGAGTKKEP